MIDVLTFRRAALTGLAAWLLTAVVVTACDGRTVGSSEDAGSTHADARSMSANADAMHADVDDAHGGIDVAAPVFADGSSCATLQSCCPFLPQVLQPTCLNILSPQNGKEMECSGSIARYVQDEEMDGGPCTGTPHPTPACAVLEKCCGLWAGMQTDPNCGKIADAANQDACTQEWEHLYYDENVCYNCVGDCLNSP